MHDARRCAMQRTAGISEIIPVSMRRFVPHSFPSESTTSPPPSRPPCFRSSCRTGTDLDVAGLGAEDLWHLRNTRRPQFTAHYLPRHPVSHFPPAALSHRRLLLTRAAFPRSPSSSPTFGSYLEDCAIFSASLISSLLPFLRTSILPDPLRVSISLSFRLLASVLCFIFPLVMH